MAARQGFEPRLTGPEPVVLPLHYRAVKRSNPRSCERPARLANRPSTAPAVYEPSVPLSTAPQPPLVAGQNLQPQRDEAEPAARSCCARSRRRLCLIATGAEPFPPPRLGQRGR